MKTTVAPYQTSAWGLRIVCKSGQTFRFCTYPFDVTMSNATVYLAAPGYEQSSIHNTSTMSAAAIDIDGFIDTAGITRAMVASGLFDGARVYIFRFDFLAPVEDYEPVTCGLFGKTTLIDNRYKIEGMGLTDALNQTVGVTYTPLCQHTFGDDPKHAIAGAVCGKSLAALQAVATVTAVTSSQVVSFGSLSGAAVDYFANGSIKFTTGDNAGLNPLTIRASAADGTITTHEDFYYPVQVGDSAILLPGCRKRKVDCQAWNNVPNALAFWDMPLSSQYVQIGGVS